MNLPVTGRIDKERKMEHEGSPRIKLLTKAAPPHGTVFYQSIPEMVVYERGDPPRAAIRTLALGRLLLALDGNEGELAGVQCYVKTGRWKSEDDPPPEPDAEGILVVMGVGSEGDLTYIPSDPGFYWHEESSSLHIFLRPGAALVFRVADCLLVAVDTAGSLTDLWLLGLDLSLE